MVFCGLFPTDADQFTDLREALGRLQLNDAALSFEPEVRPSPAPPHSFQCTCPCQWLLVEGIHNIKFSIQTGVQ